MCIVYFCQNVESNESGYQFILVNNRDEEWSRPTKAAEFWGSHLDCISGTDEKPGREGGTWLGMNKSGKVAVLLNLLGRLEHSKQSRGYLVTDYLVQDSHIDEYAEKIMKKKNEYYGFNLLLFHLRKEAGGLPPKPVYVTNGADDPSCVDTHRIALNTCFGVSNSPLEQPFQKVIKGKKRFEDIVARYPSTNMKKSLVQELFHMMSDRQSLLPDPVMVRAMRNSGTDPKHFSCRSAINIHSPHDTLGSRTTTIITVDGCGAVDFIEKTVYHNKPSKSDTVIHSTFTLDQPK